MHKGLARWLRAAGHDAWWRYGVEDRELVDLARREERVVLTSDRGVMERRTIARGEVRALFLPRELDPLAATRLVLAAFGLELLFPRCMACGGELAVIDKESARAEIPPRTFAWLSEFFRCSRCGKLFWRGTHWTRIERGLASLR
jgi:uncharacterized protein with PIN domain